MLKLICARLSLAQLKREYRTVSRRLTALGGGKAAEFAVVQRSHIVLQMKSLLLSLILLTVVPTVYSQDQLPELVRRIKPSAVAIETFDSRGEKLSRGSGFFIDSDRIVTNRHVIEGAYRAEIHSSNGTV